MVCERLFYTDYMASVWAKEDTFGHFDECKIIDSVLVDLVYYGRNRNSEVFEEFRSFADTKDISSLLKIFWNLVSEESERFLNDLKLIESCNYAYFKEADKGINFTETWAYWHSQN